MWHDLDMISHCSFIYNGEFDELTLKANSVVEKLRSVMKAQINTNNEKPKQKKLQINEK